MTSTIKINKQTDNGNRKTFTLSGIDVSYVNGIRRIIMSDIPIYGFKTSPHEESTAVIHTNTSRLNNEIIKQRLSCIPIHHVKYIDSRQPLDNYVLEIDVENKTDACYIVTTRDFRIKDKITNKYLEPTKTAQIFPPFSAPNGQEYFIDFVRLRPKISDEIPGEKIKLTCGFSVCTAKKDDSCFNVVGTIGYGYTPDFETMEQQLEIRRTKWRENGKTDTEIDFESKNWKLLEGLRYVVKNSFDFVIETLGMYTNEEILKESCNILIAKFLELKDQINTDLVITPADNTMDNCYDVVLPNETYTIGNILNYELYESYYARQPEQILDFVGFKKMHPHASESILRLAFNESATKGESGVKALLHSVVDNAIDKLRHLMSIF